MKTVGIPLILTFKLDAVSQGRLDAWREIHFPKERNFLKAHLTVYHQLPGQSINLIKTQLDEIAGSQEKIGIAFDQLMTKQGFVGIRVVSDAMQRCRSQLDLQFQSLLRAQDKQAYRPHVTLTNLGSPKDAAQTMMAMEKVFVPWSGEIVGLELFHYRGGPWELAGTFPFGAS